MALKSRNKRFRELNKNAPSHKNLCLKSPIIVKYINDCEKTPDVPDSQESKPIY